METLSDILKMTIPALIVLFTAWIILRNMIKNDRSKRRQELILQNSRTVTPIKLQAYERIVLFLERISLESLLVRVSSPDMTAPQLHTVMLNTIRSEFEKLPADSSGMALSKRLLERIMELEKEPTRVAIDYIKNEIARII